MTNNCSEDGQLLTVWKLLKDSKHGMLSWVFNKLQSSDCFEYLHKYVNEATKKIICQIFRSKKPGIENFKPQKIPLIIPVTWNPEYSRPLGVCFV